MARTQRILIVDDSSDIGEMLARLFRASGYETRIATDGFQALLIAKQFRPEFVLLDIGMPNFDGFETAKSIRSEAWSREMVLIAISGYCNQEYQRLAREAGFDRYLVKPTPMKDVLSLVEKSSHVEGDGHRKPLVSQGARRSAFQLGG